MHKLFTEGSALYLLFYLHFLYQGAWSIVERLTQLFLTDLYKQTETKPSMCEVLVLVNTVHTVFIRFVYFPGIFYFVFSRFAKPPVLQSHPQNLHYQFTLLHSFSHLFHLGNGSLSCCDCSSDSQLWRINCLPSVWGGKCKSDSYPSSHPRMRLML